MQIVRTHQQAEINEDDDDDNDLFVNVDEAFKQIDVAQLHSALSLIDRVVDFVRTSNSVLQIR
jgi:hypothetical protein